MGAPKSSHTFLLFALLSLLVLAASGRTIPSAWIKAANNAKKVVEAGKEGLDVYIKKYNEKQRVLVFQSVEKAESRVVNGKTQYKLIVSAKDSKAFGAAARCRYIFAFWYTVVDRTLTHASSQRRC